MAHHWFGRFVREDLGQDLVEYAFLVSFIAFAAAAGAQSLGDGIAGTYGTISTRLSGTGTGARGGDNPGNPTPGAGTPGQGNPGGANPGQGAGPGPTPGSGNPGQGGGPPVDSPGRGNGSGNPGKGPGQGQKP